MTVPPLLSLDPSTVQSTVLCGSVAQKAGSKEVKNEDDAHYIKARGGSCNLFLNNPCIIKQTMRWSVLGAHECPYSCPIARLDVANHTNSVHAVQPPQCKHVWGRTAEHSIVSGATRPN